MTELDLSRIQSISGFGGGNRADGYLFRPTNLQEIKDILSLARDLGRQIVLRGAGKSYGDAALGSECLILDTSRMDQIYSFHKLTGDIECGPGVTIEKLWRIGIEDGFWPPVVSGTMYPTLAGALAMNIHGKNNFCAGTLGEHVSELDVLFPNGDVRTLTPSSDLFHHVIGSAGLLGIIVRVKLRLKRITTGNLKVLPISTGNWAEQFEAFENYSDSDYMVSWIDCFAKGSSAGRGLFHAAWHVKSETLVRSTLLPSYQTLPDTILGFWPKSTVWRILKFFNTNLGMKFLNGCKYRMALWKGNRVPYQESLVAYSFLLDYVPRWQESYGARGFLQYQCFLPSLPARAVFPKLIEMQHQAGLISYLGVMKRHRPDKFLFSHAVDGYSLALDFKIPKDSERLIRLCHQMNDFVLEHGGKFYLAKDSTMRKQDFIQSVGQDAIEQMRTSKLQLDPDSILTSALAQRLEIFEGRE